MIDLSAVTAPDETLPAGEYAVIVTSTEFKPTKSGGEILEVIYTITGPICAGRKIWDRFNTKNANPVAVNIGLSQLKAMAVATGLAADTLRNFHPEMIYNKELVVTTSIKVDPTYGERVEVKKYAPTTNATAATDAIPF